MTAWVYNRRIYLDQATLAASEGLPAHDIDERCEPIELPTPAPTSAFLAWTDHGYQLIGVLGAALAASCDGEAVWMRMLPDGSYTGRAEGVDQERSAFRVAFV